MTETSVTRRLFDDTDPLLVREDMERSWTRITFAILWFFLMVIVVDITWHLLDHLHLSLCLCILITPFREWNLLCFISFLQCLCVAVFLHCISAGTSSFVYCCCETSVLCCTFWMYCTCGNLNGLRNVWTIHVDILHLANLVSLHIESGES